MIKKIKMEGLTCSGCAGKIERDINKIDYVNQASYNLANQTMIIDLKEDFNKEKTIKELDKIVRTYESGVKVYYLGEEHETKFNIFNEYTFFFIGLLLFAVYFFFYKNFYLFIGSYLLIANGIITKSIKNIIKGALIDENVLMLLATIAAIVIGEYLEGVLVIVFYTIGEYFQDKAVDKAKDSITSLMDLKVTYANLLVDGTIKVVEPETLKVGDTILVKQGEKIAIDGIVTKGNASLDTKSITGESKTLDVTINSEVLSGMINTSGILEIKVSKEYQDSTISKIIDLIENSTNEKTKTEKFITKFARIYTPIVTLIAVLLFVIPVYGFNQDFNEYLYRACIFLVISCPCALVLSVPMAYFAGIGKSARHGILFKGSNHLDSLGQVSDIFLDKTGTITKGELNVIASTNDETLKLAASVEHYSHHPIAQAIVSRVKEPYTVENIQEHPGKGLTGTINNKECLVGNSELLKSKNVLFEEKKSNHTIVYVAYDSKFVGTIELSDEIKDTSIKAINAFKKMGINVHMLTGDNEEVAKEVAHQLTIDYHASLLPEDKVNILKNYNASGLKMFIGDGINDGPVLATSDIAVSMGKVGSDVAIEVSDIVILDDNLYNINDAFDVSKKTRRIVKQNIFGTLIVKLIFLGLGAFGVSTILLALIADVGVALLAVLNSFRIIRGK